MKLTTSKLLGILAALIGIPALVIGTMVYSFVSTPVAPSQEQVLRIKQGSPFRLIATQLERAGVVSDARSFVWYARWQGTTAKIQAGEYVFGIPATPGAVLRRLVVGDVRKIQITFPEGLNLVETAQRVAEAGIGSAEQFLALVRSPAVAKQYGIPGETLEGYLFPETYTIQAETTPEELVQTMVEQLKLQLTPELLSAAGQHGLDRHQLVTLASIVQKEAGNEAEMPLISAVFHNRLQRRIPLQADPTVIYGIDHFDGNLTRKHLETPTPYNTYRKRGLPPGPIANPGQTALHATAFPAEVNYLYFVSRGNGTHEFSATLKEHNRAVQRYQLRR